MNHMEFAALESADLDNDQITSARYPLAWTATADDGEYAEVCDASTLRGVDQIHRFHFDMMRRPDCVESYLWENHDGRDFCVAAYFRQGGSQ